MKTQMRVQKYLCLAMIIVGALALLYSFAYSTGAIANLGISINTVAGNQVSAFTAAEGKYDALFYYEIQPFNTALMYCGIASILLAVLLYITSCNKRRNYYVSNYVATGLCAGGNIVMAIVLMIYNSYWKAEFLKVDFEAWNALFDRYYKLVEAGQTQYASYIHYNDSTVWFDLGYAVFAILIIASILLVLNLVWKILLMKGEKQLLAGNKLEGGIA